MLILVTGGIKSGKSRRALDIVIKGIIPQGKARTIASANIKPHMRILK